jgi:tRNA pseudouridine55 synthase
MRGRRRRDDPTLHGVLLLDKPAGPTSHDVVSWVRWVLGVRRVGHCGTLDPAATGLLVVGVGAATKLAPYLTGQDKGYRASFVLGASTTTADAQGQITDARPCPPDTEARIPAALAALRGVKSLPPPAYSAIHVDGQRAHVLARAGHAPVLEDRPMTVHELVPGPVIRRGDHVEVEATLLVSKGTYVRSLAEALGRQLDLPAHLGALHRTRSGALHLDHPHAVTGIVAEREPTAAEPGRTAKPGGAAEPRPPRWRLRLPSCETPAAAAEHLRSRLLAPSEVVPMPVLHVSDDDSGRRALARLASGQPLALPDPGLPWRPEELAACGVEGLAEAGPIGVAGPGGHPALVVARLHVGPDGARLHPERVVVSP